MENTQKTIRIGKQQISYTVRVSTRARRYRIIVSPQGVELVLPRGVPLFRADGLMRAHSAWLKKQLERMEHQIERVERRKAKEIPLPKDMILFLGKPCQLEIFRTGSLRNQVRIEQLDGTIRINAPNDKRIDFEAHLQTFLKKYAEKVITSRVGIWSREMKAAPRRISIRSQRTRWGSCSSRGTVSFNWRLVMATPEVLDYVIIHELAHLEAPNHSQHFWAIVNAHCPKFKQHRRWLRDQQSLLYRPLIRSVD